MMMIVENSQPQRFFYSRISPGGKSRQKISNIRGIGGLDYNNFESSSTLKVACLDTTTTSVSLSDSLEFGCIFSTSGVKKIRSLIKD
ncbi:hypothetical protein CQ017_03995 [Arthrobacter sp. MYb224]|nr:hypothetical protein CQ017_03995 [Arthrobacter sp. MYb224]